MLTLEREDLTGDLTVPGTVLLVVRRVMVSVEGARAKLGALLEAGKDEQIHHVIAKHGAAAGVLVPIDWYRRVSELDGDPTEFGLTSDVVPDRPPRPRKRSRATDKAPPGAD